MAKYASSADNILFGNNHVPLQKNITLEENDEFRK